MNQFSRRCTHRASVLCGGQAATETTDGTYERAITSSENQRSGWADEDYPRQLAKISKFAVTVESKEYIAASTMSGGRIRTTTGGPAMI